MNECLVGFPFLEVQSLKSVDIRNEVHGAVIHCKMKMATLCNITFLNLFIPTSLSKCPLIKV